MSLSQNLRSLYLIKYRIGQVSERLRHAKAYISTLDVSRNTVLKQSVGVGRGCLGEKGKARDGEEVGEEDKHKWGTTKHVCKCHKETHYLAC